MIIYVGSNTLVMHFKIKRIHGRNYLYLIKNQRVDGKVKQVMQMYIGSADQVYQLKTKEGKPRVASFSFGKAAALLHAAQKIGFLDIIDEHIKRRDQDGLTVGQYLLLLIAGRSEGADSRRRIKDWFSTSVLQFFFQPKHALSSQNCLNYMNRLTDQVIEPIERDIAKNLIDQGFVPTRLLFDTTNEFSYIEKNTSLTRKGKSKQKRYDKNLVGLALAVTADNLPFLSSVYPGNESDSDVFVDCFNRICSRLEGLQIDCEKISLVFDRGVNSEDNVEKVLDKMHIVGSLTRTQAKEYFTKVPLDKFSFLYKNTKDHVITGYRFNEVPLFGKTFTLVVTYNPATYKRQIKTYEKQKKKILKGINTLQKKAQRKGKGRKLTMKGAINQLTQLIPSQLRGVFDYEVTKNEDNTVQIQCRVIKEKEEQRYQAFGKTAIFTDQHKWPTKQIAQVYNSKYVIEDDFKWLRKRIIIPLQPFWVWKDISIKAHVFLCVMGLLFYRYLLIELKEEQLSLPKLAELLDGIRLAVVQENGKKAQIIIEEMTPEQARIFSKLKLDRFVPMN